MTDLWLAIAHHVFVFGLVMMLTAESVLLRAGLGASGAARLARLDIGYAVTAGLVVVAGVLRVIFGAKGALYYIENVWFWAKMASLALIGLLSVPPTLRFLRWRAALKTNPQFAPPIEAIRIARRLVRMELGLVILVAILAATMARYRGI